MAYFDSMEPAHQGSMPYRRIKRRSHRGLGLLLALGVMAMSAGGLWVGYRLSAGHTATGDIPLIHADTDPVKVKPDDPGGMEIPNRDRFVFDPTSKMPVERLLPQPESPLPRPATTSNPVLPLPSPATAAQAPQAPTQAQQAPVAAPVPALPAPAPAVTTPPSPPQTAAAPAAPSGGTGYRLQLGAVKTPEIAKTEWDRIKRQNGDLLSGRAMSVDRADLGDRGVFYRIHVGPIADAAQAERLCADLRQRGVGCILAKP